jgi:glyoxylase-like metal-dependent hydrolase (beta-lactamase superfamily II)
MKLSTGMLFSAMPGVSRIASAATAPVHTLGDGELMLLSDGNLQQPVGFLFPDSIDAAELEAVLAGTGVEDGMLKPDCNISLWRSGERTVLFDVGAGSQFMPSAGELLSSLAEVEIDPANITDVVFTHAHPDHLWGLIDDFDDLAFPEAVYHMHATEWDYWRASDTLDKTPDARKSFVVGAQNRFPLMEDRITLFEWGDEVLPGIEAVDTHGHTPGHTSFAIHQGTDSVMLLGDSITHAAVSFEKPTWPLGADQDQQTAINTRVKLLDRLASESTRIVGFHLPAPGLGFVERAGQHYKYVTA